MSEMVFIQSSPPAAFEETSEGALFVVGDEKVPVLDTLLDVNIVQPGSVKQNKALAPHVGKFLYPDLEESFATLSLLPIKIMYRGRRLFPPFGEGDGELICSSNDGETPSDRILSPVAEECGRFVEKGGKLRFEPTCEQAKWSEDGKTRPACGEVITVAFYDLSLKAPIRLQFRGTGISAWNAFLREFNKYKNIARLKGKKIYDYVIQASLENEGTYFKLSFKFQEAPEMQASAFLPLLAWYKEHLLTRPDDSDAAAAGSSSTSAEVDVTDDDDADAGVEISV